MADVSDPEIVAAIADVRSDYTDTNWCALSYSAKTTISFMAKGTGGHAELMDALEPTKVLFILLRHIDGDRETKRVKFIFIVFTGEAVGGLQRGRVGSHVGSVSPLMGQCNVQIQADDEDDVSLEVITKKLKVAGGADYDTGSNARGYSSEGTAAIRKRAMENYRTREAEGNIGKVVFATSALPQSTPVDLGGRPMVASASEAKKKYQG